MRNPLTALLTVAACLTLPFGAVAQAEGPSGGAAAPGVAFGAFSGAAVGSLGSILPCTETRWGSSCVVAVTAVGFALGGVAGGLVGDADRERLGDRATSALVGVGGGAVAGLLTRPHAQRFGALDVLAVALVGGAVGGQPRAALLGASAGAALGVVLWGTLPGFELPDAVATLLGGAMLGVWSGWIEDARAARRDSAPVLTLSLRL